MEKALIAPCGMNCALCSGYLALKHDVKSQGLRMPYCSGCRPLDKKCAILKKRCPTLLQGKVDFCFECAEFPCQRLQQVDRRYRAHFHMSMIENLVFIQKKGVAKFIKAQLKKWQCPECSELICCHNGLCYHCGLAKLKKKKKVYRWQDG